jgi:hypothetical protein
MEDEPKKESSDLVDLKSCRIVLDPKSQEILAVCSAEIIEKAAKIQPKRIVFELEEEKTTP